MADADRRSALMSAAYLYSGRPLEAFQLDVMSKQPRVLATAQTFEDWLKHVDDIQPSGQWRGDDAFPSVPG